MDRESQLIPTKLQWLGFIMGLGEHSSASTNKETFNKICVLTELFLENADPKIVLCSLDLSHTSESLKMLQPILRFDNFIGSMLNHKLVVVGSVLFLFGGVEFPSLLRRREWNYYDFSCGTSVNVDFESLRSGPPMKSAKRHPEAVVIGGFRICVFETTLFTNRTLQGFEKCGPPSFEVFNTMTWSWTELPEVADYSKFGLDKILITSHCVWRSCLIICSDIGIFGINLDDQDPRWVTMMESRFNRVPFLGRWELVEESCCSPFEVAEWGDIQSYPLNFENEKSLGPINESGVLCSEQAENGTILCSVRGTVMSPGVPVLSVNIFDTKDCRDLRIIRSDKSASFSIESQTCLAMDIVGCFQLKDIKLMGNPGR